MGYINIFILAEVRKRASHVGEVNMYLLHFLVCVMFVYIIIYYECLREVYAFHLLSSSRYPILNKSTTSLICVEGDGTLRSLGKDFSFPAGGPVHFVEESVLEGCVFRVLILIVP